MCAAGVTMNPHVPNIYVLQPIIQHMAPVHRYIIPKIHITFIPTYLQESSDATSAQRPLLT
jgi:hypothetical protein